MNPALPAPPDTAAPADPSAAGSEFARRIAHLDMDAFYASVELARRPELAGQPIIVGGRGDPESRGVVTTANYEARKFGVHSAMPMAKAVRLCPQAVFLPVDFAEYRRVSRLFKAAIVEIAPVMEDRGIDEVYLDLTEHEEPTRVLGLALKAAVKEATGLSCSIGIAPNKLLAKIASDLEKPNGLTIIRTQDLATRIWPLPARKVNGIGPKASEKLTALGVNTIGELAACEPGWLVSHFGKSYGAWLHRAANGIDARPVETESERKSLSRETTFATDLHPVRDWQALARLLAELAREVAADLAKHRLRGRTIGVKVRNDQFAITTRDLSLPEFTDRESVIRKAAFECFARVPQHRKLRLLGIRVSNFEAG